MRNKKIKMVVDSCIFIRSMVFAKNYESSAKTLDKLLELLEENKIELVFSQDTIGELIYVMKNKVLHYINNEKERFLIMDSITSLFYYSYSVNTEKTISPKCKDKKDDMLLKCAKQGRATYLISDDFRSGMQLVDNLKFKVISSNQFIDLFDSGELGDVAMDDVIGE